MQPESWERVERWLGAAKPSVSSIVTSRGGWDDIYERGQELIRRDNEGAAQTGWVGADRMTWRSPFNARRFPKQTGQRCKRKAIPGGTVCRWHGGAASHLKVKAAIRAEVMNWGLGDSHVDPGEVLLRLVTQSAARAEMYARLLQEAFDAAERLKEAHEKGTNIEAVGDENADTAETARRDLDRIFNTGRRSCACRQQLRRSEGCRPLRHR